MSSGYRRARRFRAWASSAGALRPLRALAWSAGARGGAWRRPPALAAVRGVVPRRSPRFVAWSPRPLAAVRGVVRLRSPRFLASSPRPLPVLRGAVRRRTRRFVASSAGRSRRCVASSPHARGASWRRPPAHAALRGVVRRRTRRFAARALRSQAHPPRRRPRGPVRGCSAGWCACRRVSRVLRNTSRAAETNRRWLASKSGANPRQFAGVVAAGRAKV
jgi:hypothetical protein